MPLFKWGRFTSHAGLSLDWKIDCNALAPEDWPCLAKVVASRFKFGEVIGIPTGGYCFSNALRDHRTPGNSTLLIVDDVLTTGKSMEEERAKHPGRPVQGVVLFSRMWVRPLWIEPIFQLGVPFIHWPEEKGDAQPAVYDALRTGMLSPDEG